MTQTDSPRTLRADARSGTPLIVIAERVIVQYLGVAAGESLAVIVDEDADYVVAEALYAAGLAAGADAALVRVPTRARSGAEPPSAVAALMAGADVVACVTKKSLYHTRATGAAKAAGTRGVFNSPSTLEAWTHGAMTADYVALRVIAEHVADRLRGADRAHVTSPAGTDVSMSILGRAPKGWWIAICRQPGEVSALPGGEVSLPPIRLEVEAGLVTRITGGEAAARLERLIEGVAGARNIGELGIGLNPLARLGSDITEAKKRAGTAHMAIGDNAGGYGGVVECDLHLDGMLLEPTITVDGTDLVCGGELRL